MAARIRDLVNRANKARGGDVQASDHGQDALDKVKDALGNLTGKTK